MNREVRYDDGSRDRNTHRLVERTHQRSMVCLCGSLGRVDPRRLRLHRISVNHCADRQGVRRAGARSGGGVDDHAVDAASRRHCQRVARRPDRPQDAADDLDRLVFGLQFPGRPGAELLFAVPLPGAARHRHGRGVAGRRRPRDGDVADALARLYGRRDAGLVGDWVLGWRGLLMIGIAPALLIIYIRLFVKEPEIWVENQRQQKAQNREVRAPLFSIFKSEMLGNTLTTCLMMASAFVIYYANYALFATHLQLDLHLSPAL